MDKTERKTADRGRKVRGTARSRNGRSVRREKRNRKAGKKRRADQNDQNNGEKTKTTGSRRKKRRESKNSREHRAGERFFLLQCCRRMDVSEKQKTPAGDSGCGVRQGKKRQNLRGGMPPAPSGGRADRVGTERTKETRAVHVTAGAPGRCRAQCRVHPVAGPQVSRESVVAAAAIAEDDGGQHDDPGAAVVVKQSAEAVVHSIYLSLMAPSGHRHLRPAVRFFPHSMSAYAKGAIPCGIRRGIAASGFSGCRRRRADPWNPAVSAKTPWPYQSPVFSGGCSWPQSR